MARPDSPTPPDPANGNGSGARPPKIPQLPLRHDATFSMKERRAKKQLLIDTLPEAGTVYHACKAAGVSLATYNRWLQEDDAFADAIRTVKKIPGHMIERVAMRRALDARINADPLRIFMLKNLLPDSYGESDKLSLEIKIQDVLVSHFVSVIQQTVPEVCPHCKTHLGLSESLARELKDYSARVGKSDADA